MRIYEQVARAGINFPVIQATTEDPKVNIDVIACNGCDTLLLKIAEERFGCSHRLGRTKNPLT